MDSGAGLVLQLFSCFTGDESAMELWLLLSSSRDRKIVVRLWFAVEYIMKSSINLLVFGNTPCISIIPGEELFSGVVSSEPYFSSLPFFLFLFFCNHRQGAETL